MNKLLLIGLFASIIFIACGVKPGAYIGMKSPIIRKIRDQYYSLITIPFKFLSINDVTDGPVSFVGTTLQLVNDDPNNTIFEFDESNNVLITNVANTDIKAHLSWKHSGEGKTGSADVSGKLSNIKISVSFSTTQSGTQIKPQVKITQVSLIYNQADLSYVQNCDVCSDNVKNSVIQTLKGKLFDQIKSQATQIFDERISGIINLQLQTLYPETFPLTPDITINIGNTGPILVKKNFLAVPIDTTIYFNKDGYKRPTEPTDIDLNNVHVNGDIMLFISNYSFKCIENIINTFKAHFETSVYGVTVQIDIDGSKTPFRLYTQDGVMLLSAGGIITVPLYSSSVQFKIDSKVDIDLFKGDSYAMMYMNPKVLDADFSQFILNIFGIPLDLTNSLIPYVNTIMEKLLNLLMFPTYRVSKIDAFPVTATSAQLEFYTNNIELGVTISYGESSE